MNSTILAERQAVAIQAITAHVARLGGEYVQPTARANGPAAKYVLILEAIARALASINQDAPPPADAPEAVTVEPEKPKTAAKRKGGL